MKNSEKLTMRKIASMHISMQEVKKEMNGNDFSLNFLRELVNAIGFGNLQTLTASSHSQNLKNVIKILENYHRNSFKCYTRLEII